MGPSGFFHGEMCFRSLSMETSIFNNGILFRSMRILRVEVLLESRILWEMAGNGRRRYLSRFVDLNRSRSILGILQIFSTAIISS